MFKKIYKHLFRFIIISFHDNLVKLKMSERNKNKISEINEIDNIINKIENLLTCFTNLFKNIILLVETLDKINLDK